MRRLTLEFLKTEAGSGLVLGAAAILALICANSSLAWAYFGLIRAPFTIQIGSFRQTASTLDWVKDGLMAVFFLVVGLELKFETLKGELANPRRLAVPILAALAGMVVPALVYLAVINGAARVPGAWATPTATDIAFALAALAAASKRLPGSLRVFLLTLAMVDDMGAVGLIGVLFSHGLHLAPALGAAVTLAALAGLGRWKQAPTFAYVFGFLLAWAFTIKSGVPTSAVAFLAALTVPLGPRRRAQDGMLQQMMQSLHPYVAFLILPLFAFTAAGFSFRGLSVASLTRPVFLGVFLGLFLGKQIGVFLAAFAAAVLKLGRKPTGATWVEMYGVSLLCGIGFTMSLFIGALAFPAADPQTQADVRLGVAAASVLSGLLGMAVLRWAGGRRTRAAGA
ncbi:MAG TPA: Na+/H+ antiporter NhaA [Caulobacteraceae bacterium]|nr:Na+/H+ antiporter NhaA [Caulobacteraceae bacterium]